MPTHRGWRNRPATPSRTWTLPVELCPWGRHCTLCDTCVRAGHARPSRLTTAQVIDYFLCYTSGNVKETTLKSYRPALQPLRDLLKPIGETTTDDLQVVKTILLKRNKTKRLVDPAHTGNQPIRAVPTIVNCVTPISISC